MRLSMTSLINTAPAAHSPPKPRPCRLRVSSSCSYDCVSPDRNVKNANQRIVRRRTVTRPYRSARMPAIQPPTDENNKAAVASVPACACDIAQRPMSVGMTTAYSCTSIASSAHPVKQAANVRRSRTLQGSGAEASQRPNFHLTELDHTGTILQRKRAACVFGVVGIGGFHTVERHGQVSALRANLVRVPF